MSRVSGRHREARKVVPVSTVESPHDSAAVRVLVALMHTEAAEALLPGILPHAFPWLRFLPTQDKAAFANELVNSLRAVDSPDDLASMDQLIVEVAEHRRDSR
jgi:hypothetical protein